MQTKTANRLALLALTATLSACATPPTQPESSPDHPTIARADREAPPGFDASDEQDWTSFLPAGDRRKMWVGGQPSADALDEFKARGGEVVLNLKTNEEMLVHPGFADEVEQRGLTYIHVPTAPEEMGPESAARFHAAMEEAATHEGGVMIHCQASGRALYALAIERVRKGTWSPNQAIEWARWMRKGDGWEAGEHAIRAVAREQSTLNND